MARGTLKAAKASWILVVFILIGIVLGGFIGDALGSNPYLQFLNYGFQFGISPDSPMVVSLGVFTLCFGLQVHINIASVIGIILAVVLYKVL